MAQAGYKDKINIVDKEITKLKEQIDSLSSEQMQDAMLLEVEQASISKKQAQLVEAQYLLSQLQDEHQQIYS